MRALVLTSLAILSVVACEKKTTTPIPPEAPVIETAPAVVENAETAPAPSPATVISILLHVDAEGVAVGGYDPVSYFGGAPAKGDPAIVSIVDGASYRFATSENKAAFDADPAKFQPQYGGFCAYGASEGGKFPTDPETGAVVNGKLYFNKDKGVQALWNADREARIAKADEMWPSIAYDFPQQ